VPRPTKDVGTGTARSSSESGPEMIVRTGSRVGHQMIHEPTWAGEPSPMIRKAKGCYFWDIQDRKIFDGNSGLQNVHIGHGHPEMATTAARQIEELDFFPLYSGSHVVAERLADRLHELLPHLERFYFLNSGSEAVEAGIKIVAEYWALRGQPHRNVLVARKGSYHGSTIGALSATGLEVLRGPFSDLLIRSEFISDPEVEPGESEDQATDRLLTELRDTIRRAGPESILAIVAEPVQLWGARVPPSRYWKGLRDTCDEFDVPLLADEVITGFGRTGKWFGLDHWDVQADVVALGKGIASGYAPISALGIGRKISDVFDAEGAVFHHISTTSGHPVSSSLALKNIDVIEQEDLVTRSAQNGSHLRDLLQDAFGSKPYVTAVRGIGLLNSVLFDTQLVPSGPEASAGLRRACFNNGAYLRADGQLWFIPPLVATAVQLEALVEMASQAVEDWLAEDRTE
jgi:adenosylmethionine-8-amino-7-oxononanoate aminotransferase